MSWLNLSATVELRTTSWSPSATLALTASGAESARHTSAADDSSRTMWKTHQRRFSIAANPRLRVKVWRIKGSSAGYSDRPHRLFHAQSGINCNGYPAYCACWLTVFLAENPPYARTT